MQNSVAPVAAVCFAASTSAGMSSQTARTGEVNRPDWEQKWQSSGQPPVLSETMPSTSTSGPHQRIRTWWAASSAAAISSSGRCRTASTPASSRPTPVSMTSVTALARSGSVKSGMPVPYKAVFADLGVLGNSRVRSRSSSAAVPIAPRASGLST